MSYQWHRLGAAALIACTVISLNFTAPIVAEAATTCGWTRSVLPVPVGHERGEARAGDGRGNVVGATDVKAENPYFAPTRYAALWENGKLSYSASTPDRNFSDINKAGVIVGRVASSGHSEATRFDRTGAAVALPRALQWDSSGATAINERGDIVGWALISPTPTTFHFSVVLWPANTTGTFRLLPTPKPLTSLPEVADIDENGRIIATLYYSDESDSAVTWDENQNIRTLQPTPSGKKVWWPKAIRAGRILAESAEGAGEWGVDGKYLRALDSGRGATGYTIGAKGTVGGSRLSQQYHSHQPAMWREGQLTAILPSDLLYQGAVRHISDDEMTAYGTETYSMVMPPVYFSKNAVLWRCV